MKDDVYINATNLCHLRAIQYHLNEIIFTDDETEARRDSAAIILSELRQECQEAATKEHQ